MPNSIEMGDSSDRAAGSPGLIGPPLLIALAALIGSLWLSMGMGLRACPFCFYQRTFIMAVVAVLGVGFLAGSRYRGILNFLVLPLVVAGFGVALFHVWIELDGKLECPSGVLGLGTAPQQSLAVYALLLAAVIVSVVRGWNAVPSPTAVTAIGIVVGLLLTAASVLSSPPMPPAPTRAYETPLDICRPPFRPQ